MAQSPPPIDALVLAAAEEAMGERVVAWGLFRPRVNLAPGRGGGLFGLLSWLVESVVWIRRRGRALRLPHPVYVMLSESTISFVRIRFGAAVTARVQYSWPRTSVHPLQGVEDRPFWIDLAVPGRRTAFIEAIDPGPRSAEVIELLTTALPSDM